MAAPSGTKWGSIVGGYGRLGIYYELLDTSTETISKYRIRVYIWTKYSVQDGNNKFYFDVMSSSGDPTTLLLTNEIRTDINSGDGWDTANQVQIYTKLIDITKTTTSQTKYACAKLTDVDRVGGTMTVSASIYVYPIDSYNVSYNANGGTGAPTLQKKFHGINLTLSTTKPTRTGYKFIGWGKSSSSLIATYASGGVYILNAPITLYAVWEANTYTITYNANGGTGAPSNQTKIYGKTLTLSSVKPTRTNYIFKGWSTSSTATTALYTNGGKYTANAAATLYAVWQLDYVKPRLFNIVVSRYDSASDRIGENGTECFVSFDWITSVDNSGGDIIISISNSSGTQWYQTVVGSSGSTGTSGSFSVYLLNSNGYSFIEDESYTVNIEIYDTIDSTTVTRTLNSIIYTIDYLNGGRGVAFGKAASIRDTAEFDFNAKFNKPVYGNALGMNKLPPIPANSDLNDLAYVEHTGCYAVYRNDDAATIENIPVARAGRLEVWSATGEGIRVEEWSYIRQRYVPYNRVNPVWERDITRGENNTWTYGEWSPTSLTPTTSEYLYAYKGISVLWGGTLTSGMYMTADHTISLSNSVSSQRHGIILVFSAWNGTSDTNYSWQSFFIPKQLVAATTAGHTFVLGRGKFTYTGTKYLYINDTTITGHADNNLSGTNNGITYNNAKFVLRYVFGV